MAWTTRLNNTTIETRDGSATEFGKTWDLCNPTIRQNLTTALSLAPVMIRCATEALAEYESFMGGADSETRAQLAAEVGEGLCKYFELHEILEKHGNVPRWLRGMVTVYGRIAQGLQGAWTLVLFNKGGDDIRGRTALDGTVTYQGSNTPSLTRQAFGFPDEYGHVDWQGFMGGLLLSEQFISSPTAKQGWTKAEEIARVIVHEGSHRWAQTKDILYKHKSAAALGKIDEQFSTDEGMNQYMENTHGKYKWNNTVKAPRKAEMIAEKRASLLAGQQAGLQNLVFDERAGKKPLLSMNLKGLADKSPIDPIRWLENADSYSWFARRMWKRAGRPTA
jgi:hypothetical protein